LTSIFRPFSAPFKLFPEDQGRRASRLPLAIILRAVGALSSAARCFKFHWLSYYAPLALLAVPHVA